MSKKPTLRSEVKKLKHLVALAYILLLFVALSTAGLYLALAHEIDVLNNIDDYLFYLLTTMSSH